MNDELISIIVPIYNGEKYLERCINSIISQTYNNIEIILIDDGSKDSTYSICTELSKKDNRITTIYKENSGVSSTRNIGITIAKGNYIMFVDCDDTIEKDCCELLYNALLKYDADISCGEIKKSRDIIKHDTTKENKYLLFDNDKLPLIKLIYHNTYKDFNYVESPVAKIYKKSIIIENNIQFDKSLKYGEDALFNMQIYNKAVKVVLQSKVVYNYIVNEESASFGKLFNLQEEYFRMMNRHKEVLISLNIFKALEKDYDYFCFRQVNKLIKYYITKENISKAKYLELLKEPEINTIIKRVDTSLLNRNDKIKHLLYSMKIYSFLKLSYK